MTTENIRLVVVEATSSAKRYVFQYDTGFPQATRVTFAIDVPYYLMLQWAPGSTAFSLSQETSRVESVGGGITTSDITTFTFRPGAAADPTNRIYDTWAALMTAHNANTGQRLIYFDNSSASITIPTGSHPFNSRTRLLPAAGMTLPVDVTLAAGAILDSPSFISSPALRIGAAP